MGLFDDPVGTIFGSGEKTGAVDRRVSREPEGQRWWENWERTFGSGGPMDPMVVYPKMMAGLDQLMGWSGGQRLPASGGPGLGMLSQTMASAPVKVSLGGKSYSVTPRWARDLPFRYAAAVSSLMNPWLQGGMQLESGRIGMPYYQAPTDGLFGDVVRGISGGFGKSYGQAAGGYAAGKTFGK